MSRKSKKQSIKGTYALCVTAGLILGLGLGPAFGNVLAASLAGGILGAVTAYVLTHPRRKRSQSHK